MHNLNFRGLPGSLHLSGYEHCALAHRFRSEKRSTADFGAARARLYTNQKGESALEFTHLDHPGSPGGVPRAKKRCPQANLGGSLFNGDIEIA